jgi:hypothetical protein
MVLNGSLQGLNFAARHINLLTDQTAILNTKGLTFFARVGDGSSAHYAKVVILKNAPGGGYLHDPTANSFIQVKVSYQTAAGVPYAKYFGN